MSAARHIPHHLEHGDKAAVTWPVTFTYNGTTLSNSAPAFKGVSSGDTVTFSSSSSSTATIVITFAANPTGVTNPPGPQLWNDTSITLAPGASKNETVLATTINGSVNYTVSVNGVQVGGPYAIQVGAGPIYVQITASYSQPDPVAVPKGGTLGVYSNDSNTYNVRFPGSLNPFPTITQANPGYANNNPGTQTGPATTYSYTVGVKGTEGPGGGHVIVT